MDANRFDNLVKQVATTRLTRLNALRGLAAAGIAALTGVTLFADEADARRLGRVKRKKVCVCGNSNPGSCKNVKVIKKKAKKIQKRKPCSYRGKCRGVSGCPGGGGGTGGGGGGGTPATAGFPMTVDPAPISTACGAGDTCDTGHACIGGFCLDVCLVDDDCPAGYTCVLAEGVCLPDDVADELPCVTGADCDTGRCVDLVCELCPILSICGAPGTEQCCVVGASCDPTLDICVL